MNEFWHEAEDWHESEDCLRGILLRLDVSRVDMLSLEIPEQLTPNTRLWQKLLPEFAVEQTKITTTEAPAWSTAVPKGAQKDQFVGSRTYAQLCITCTSLRP